MKTIKRENTASRLKEIMKQRNLRQVDILEMTKPYCNFYGIKMNKSDISQYVSGKVEPSQEKLVILGLALNVNESWLIGFNTPMERSDNVDANYITEHLTQNTIVFEITARSLKYSPKIFTAIIEQLKEMFSNKECGIYYRNTYSVHNIYELLNHTDISYDDKAFVLRSIIDYIIFDTKSNTLTTFYAIEQDAESNELNTILYNCSKLNIVGLNKVCEYSSDLSSMKQYRKNIKSNKKPTLKNIDNK